MHNETPQWNVRNSSSSITGREYKRGDLERVLYWPRWAGTWELKVPELEEEKLRHLEKVTSVLAGCA